MMDGGIDTTSDISTPLIVVGVDGSVGSREALQWAFAYAELSGAAVPAVMARRLPGHVFVDASRHAQLLVVGSHGQGNSSGSSSTRPARTASTTPNAR
jgi:hypothetical protein